MQMAYGDKKLFYIFFWFIIEKKWLSSWNASRKGGFVIFLQGPNAKDLNIAHF